ncbi:MAG: HD domain-containing phosphohydrolase [Tepidisphaeraceae bacterium]|jgi:putative two-component system response regulator
MKILIADDDIVAMELLKDLLTDAGHEVSCASNGREALEILRRSEHRVVITDWEMPVMSGVEFCEAVRSSGEFEGYIYIILLTCHGTIAERVAGLSAGADDFISKPFEPAELLARIQAADRILSMETRDVAIFAMAKLAESRDPETGSHLERVMNFSRVLAKQLPAIGRLTDQIDGDFVRAIYATSPLHDIGKVGIPDCVLLKPGRLSDREFAIMKTHTTIGAQTLDAALRRFPGTRFLEMARDTAATHHEHFDGSGYPAGLRGNNIPLCGRIVAVADVYDAMTSKRVYKEAFSHDIARSLILKESGTQFDPDVVDAFLTAEQAFISIRERFTEPHSVAA